MKHIKKTIIFILALLSFSPIYSQNKSIFRGRVIDKSDRTTIIGANVVEYDEQDRIVRGKNTDVNGDFVLEMTDRTHVVKVSMIGYITQTIKVDLTKPVMVELVPDNIQIDEVVVTAKTQATNRLTNVAERDNATSTTKIDLVQMADAGITSAADALQGQVSGLDIISASGDPGSGSQLVIRGLSSMGSSRPLIVIDGIPQMRVSAGFDLTSADQEDISELVNIAVQDIKSIEVLKDAASTAIYGSQGSDGVLLIETYKGRMGKVQFDYTYKYYMTYQPPAIPMLNGDEYIMLQLEEWHNARGVFDLPDEIAYNRDYDGFYNYSQNTDWLAAITQIGSINDHYFKVSGGGEKTRYFTSFSYVDDIGTTINTRSQRFSTRINLDYYLSKNLLFTVMFNYTRNKTEGNSTPSGNVRSMAYTKAPNMSIWEYDSQGKLTGEYFTPINSYQGNGTSYYNPVAIVNLSQDDRLNHQLQNTFTLDYRIYDWLKFTETVSLQYQGFKSNSFLPYNAVGTDWLASTVNRAIEENQITYAIKTETGLNFNLPTKSSHSLSGALSWTTEQSGYEGLRVGANKLPSVSIKDPALDAQIENMWTYIGEGRRANGVLNLNYKFKDKYGLTVNLNADASASFGVNNRWGLFYGIAGFWRFSDEKWFDSWEFLGESKLRASYGTVGRAPSDPYGRFASYNTSSSGYITNPVVVPGSIQLSNIKWETTNSVDLGLELNLFNDKLYLEGDYYNKLTTDILFPGFAIPTSSGFSSLGNLNGGALRNIGWEFMLDWKILRSKNLTWSVNFNATQNLNSFEDLPDNFNSERDVAIGNKVYPKRVMIGEPIGSFFGFRYLGVWSSDEEVKGYDAEGKVLVDSEGKTLPFTYLGTYPFKGGDAKYEDINHDGKIDLNDVVYIGDSNPDYIGGFGTTLKYKNFDVSFTFNYRLGFDIVNMTAANTQSMTDRANQSKVVLSRWRVQGQNFDNMIPRAYLNHPANNLGSDRYLEAGDFLRLNNVKLGYRVPQTLCTKIGLRNASVVLSARRLLTFTNYTGQDPEVGLGSDAFWIGVDNANTPPTKQVTLTLQLGF
jgi:TonB-linked SusC/RagA family outer membrane protein